MRKHLKVCAVALVVMGLTTPALAADIFVTVNTAEQTITIANQLNSDINLVALTNGTETFEAGDTIPANNVVTIRTTREIPAGLNAAIGRSATEAGIPGRQADENGLYSLSVSSNF